LEPSGKQNGSAASLPKWHGHLARGSYRERQRRRTKQSRQRRKYLVAGRARTAAHRSGCALLFGRSTAECVSTRHTGKMPCQVCAVGAAQALACMRCRRDACTQCRGLPCPQAQTENGPCPIVRSREPIRAGRHPMPSRRRMRTVRWGGCGGWGFSGRCRPKIEAAYLLYGFAGGSRMTMRARSCSRRPMAPARGCLIDGIPRARTIEVGQTLANFPDHRAGRISRDAGGLTRAPPMPCRCCGRWSCNSWVRTGGTLRLVRPPARSRPRRWPGPPGPAPGLKSGEDVAVLKCSTGIGRAIRDDLRNLLMFRSARLSGDWETLRERSMTWHPVEASVTPARRGRWRRCVRS